MVPADSCRISRVPHYSGAGSAVFRISPTGLSPAMADLSRSFGYPSVVPLSPVLLPRLCRNTAGLGSCAFARHYWRNHCCFLFLRVLRCFSSPGWLQSLTDGAPCGASGCPIRTSAVMAGICPLPRLFAACHVLRRLREPRHPSCALVSFPYALMSCFLFEFLLLWLTLACARVSLVARSFFVSESLRRYSLGMCPARLG